MSRRFSEGSQSTTVRIVRNTGYIRQRKRGAKLMAGLGLLMLLGSWGLVIVSANLFLFGTIGLAFGFIFFNAGMQQVARWSRRPRTDVELDTVLQRLNDRHTLIHYPALPGRRPDHVLVTPTGLLVMTVREIGGRMRVDGRRWRRLGSPFGRVFVFGGPQLGNPTDENELQVKAVRDLLEAEEQSAEIEGAVVFVHPDVEVEINEATVPILHITELMDHIRSDSGQQATLSGKDRDALVELLSRGDELERSGSSQATPAKKKVRAI
jgi:hypothetical protein